MRDKQPLELNEDWKTGTNCPETSYYCCAMHPSWEAWVVAGTPFPPCERKGLAHSTTWHKLVKSN